MITLNHTEEQLGETFLVFGHILEDDFQSSDEYITLQSQMTNDQMTVQPKSKNNDKCFPNQMRC